MSGSPLFQVLVALLVATSCSTRGAPEQDDVPVSYRVLHPDGGAFAGLAVHGERLVDAGLEGRLGRDLGSVDDVLLDPESGSVVAVLATLEGVEGRQVLDLRSLQWEGDAAQPWLAVSLASEETHPLEGVDRAALFEGQEPELIEGVVTALETVDTAPASITVVTLRDEENLLRRVLFDAAPLVARRLPGLAVGQAVEVEGVLTRDEKGKLWIASAAARGDEQLRLRDEAGGLAWDGLTRGLVSARHMVEGTLTAAGGIELPLRGWVLDRETGRATHLCVEVDGVERALPYGDAAWSEQDGWSIDADAQALMQHEPCARVLAGEGSG